MEKCRLQISSDQKKIWILDDAGNVIFQGDSWQAIRVANLMPKLARGKGYLADMPGTYHKQGTNLVVTFREWSELDSSTTLVIEIDEVKKIIVEWD